jgi:hypothetical protein
VQASSSEHWAPSLPGFWVQLSVTGSQKPTWQLSLLGQKASVPLVQTPALQVSFWVQALPSSHGVPSFAGTFWQAPLMQVPRLHRSVRDAQSPAADAGADRASVARSRPPLPPVAPVPPMPLVVVELPPAPVVVEESMSAVAHDDRGGGRG